MTGPLERSLGIEAYGTRGMACPCVAKRFHEDFMVDESISLEGVSEARPQGWVPVYRVEKRGIDTLHMAEEMSRVLKSRVSYGGLKDKRAVASQYVTATSARSEAPKKVEGRMYTAELVGFLPRPLSRASVSGNRFSITLRDCCPTIGSSIEEAMAAAEGRRVPNYYGLQRFGVRGVGTHRVGERMVMGDFQGAVEALVAGEDVEAREAFNAGRYSEVSERLPRGRDMEQRVARELAKRPGEWARALRAVPVRIRRFYVQAYQSWIFNRTLSRALKKGLDISRYESGDNWATVSSDGLRLSVVQGVRDPPSKNAVPMVQVPGYAYRDYGSRFDGCLKEVLAEDGADPRRFYIQGMQEASSEGSFRRPHLAISGQSWRVDGGRAELRFTLARGSYATVFLREIAKADDPVAAGLG